MFVTSLEEFDVLTFLEDIVETIHAGIALRGRVDDDHIALLLCRHRDSRYAVCLVRPHARVAIAPNYALLEQGDFTLCGPACPEGLNDILCWTDRITALDRYRALTDVSAGTSARRNRLHLVVPMREDANA